MKKPIREIIFFTQIADAFLQKEKKSGKSTKIARCIKKLVGDRDIAIVGILKSLHDKFNEEKEDIYIDNAATDENDKTLLRDNNGNYKFTTAGQKAVNKQMKILLDKEADFTPVYCDEIPKTLTETELFAFKDFVIK